MTPLVQQISALYDKLAIIRASEDSFNSIPKQTLIEIIEEEIAQLMRQKRAEMHGCKEQAPPQNARSKAKTKDWLTR